MPIRFQCPECHSKLKIGSHKVGSRKSCPYCGIDFVVPSAREGEMPTALRWTGQKSNARKERAGAKHDRADTGGEAPPTPAPPTDAPSETLAVSSDTAAIQPLAPRTATADITAPPRPAEANRLRSASGTLEIPRRMIYVVGGLLTVVALFFFLFGVMTGRKLAPRRAAVMPASTEKCVLSGSVHYRQDNQRVADKDSIVIFMPLDAVPDIRPEAASLHPEQQAAADSPDAQLIRTFGGEVTRVDNRGSFRTVLASGRSYDVLVISKNRADESGLAKELRANWGRVFVPLEPVIGEQARYATQIQLKGTTQSLPPVVFD